MMTTYWFPSEAGDGYNPVEADDADVTWIDVHCKACGAASTRRLARFVQLHEGGPVGIKPFTVDGQPRGPWFKVAGNVIRFRLKCSRGHDTNCTVAEAADLLAARRRGALPTRVAR
ncbi:hypothetical protein HDA40_006100 [Hamadaea flava]|uniref:Uncharacterized protein n=1 Tax=Hamadaea flava TaxID=1742688 RepID=A0ABV8LWB9_9ACTN|nr:hypothetical protein [Hamadaea flava]MCP2327593.1 hypothetical protein [Hamadaea flava]